MFRLDDFTFCIVPDNEQITMEKKTNNDEIKHST